jgi:hypothetical protein
VATKVAKSQHLTQMVNFKMSKGDARLIREFAKKNDVSMSAVIRGCLTSFISAQKKKAAR